MLVYQRVCHLARSLRPEGSPGQSTAPTAIWVFHLEVPTVAKLHGVGQNEFFAQHVQYIHILYNKYIYIYSVYIYIILIYIYIYCCILYYDM